MAVETELKLRVSPEQLARLKRHALLKTHSVTRPVMRRLYNIYFDTAKQELRQSGMALRLRRTGRLWLQTLKGGGSVQGGLHQRNEWEVAVDGPALDFAALPAEVADVHLPVALHKKLRPIFVTDFVRTSRMLNFQGAQIELCMDHGEISSEQHSMPICELELELKSGEPKQLFELALAILEVIPLELEAVSKAEHGYRLLSGDSSQPVKGIVPPLAGKSSLADMFKTLIWSCLQHFQSNLSGAMSGDDAEYLHQMRVALRRLRVLLRMAEKIHADPQLAELGKGYSLLSATLGQIREWDVFIAQTMHPMCKRMPGHEGLKAVLVDSERRRAACYAELRAKARELQSLLLRFAIWMNGPAYWQQPGWRQQAQDYTARKLDGFAQRYALAGFKPDTFDAARLHALRILAKKLRYSAEFFASLYDRKKAQSFLDALSKVQEVLGQINDVAVAYRLLEELAADADVSGHQEAVVLAQGWIAHDLSGQFSALRKAMKNFNRQPLFWKNN
ncbi:MAG: CHAD domain-containing protein [Nitrosomonadales bacterium]|nr:CHAD domain-containing protein [Nitrosomonadales bacterium]